MPEGKNYLASLGIDKVASTNASVGANNDFYSSAKTAPAPKSNFLGNVANAAKAIPGAVGGFLADAFIKPTSHFLTSSVSALQAGQFTASQDSMRQNLDKQIKDLSARYKSNDPKARISKDAYQAGIRQVQKQYEQMNTEATAYGDKLGTPGEAVKSAAEVLAMPLAVGKLVKGGKVLSALEQAAGKIPSVGKALAAPAVEQSAAKALALGAAKYPLITKPTVDLGLDTAKDVKDGKLGSAALGAGLLATGLSARGPIGLLKAGAEGAGKIASRAVMGQESLFKNIKTKDGTLLGFVQGLEKKAAAGSKQAAKDLEIARVFQQYKLDETGGNVKSSIRELTEHYKNRPTEHLSGREVFTDFKKFYQSTEKVKAADAAGKLSRTESQANLSAKVGRFSKDDANELKATIEGISDPGQRRAAAFSFLEKSDAGKNPTLREDIMAAVEKGTINTKRLTSLTSEAKVAGLERGYFPIFTKNARAEFKPVAETAKSFKETKPVIPGVRGILRKAGISPESVDPTVNARIANDAVSKINNLGISSLKGSESSDASIGKQATDRLLALLDHKVGASDVRQLSIKDIASELGITHPQARDIRRAIHDAHFSVSLGERGLGQRVQDLNLKFNPLARGYSRIQGAAKYELNPFFRAQTNIETELLGQGLTGGDTQTLKRLVGRADVQKARQQMEESGMFRGERGAGAGQGGPFISAKLTTRQKDTLSATAQVLADQRGKSVPDMLKDPAMRDSLRSIVQYPEKGIFSSNLARTANLAFFPVSYNFKVAKLAANGLSKLSPVTQIATIKAVGDFNDFLDTDDGIKWQSKNSEALGMLQYFTPINSIQSVYKILTGKADASTFGQIGGLPFGLISQVLQDHGVFKADTPYLNPKTGEVVPDKIPSDLRASGAVLLRDTLNSMYNFPGRTIGLGSKGDFTNVLTGGLSKQGEFKDNTRTDLTPRQERQNKLLAPKQVQPAKTQVKFNVPANPAGGRINIIPGPGKKVKTKKPKTLARPIGTA